MAIWLSKDGKWMFTKACTMPWCHRVVHFEVKTTKAMRGMAGGISLTGVVYSGFIVSIVSAQMFSLHQRLWRLTRPQKFPQFQLQEQVPSWGMGAGCRHVAYSNSPHLSVMGMRSQLATKWHFWLRGGSTASTFIHCTTSCRPHCSFLYNRQKLLRCEHRRQHHFTQSQSPPHPRRRPRPPCVSPTPSVPLSVPPSIPPNVSPSH